MFQWKFKFISKYEIALQRNKPQCFVGDFGLESQTGNLFVAPCCVTQGNSL